MQSSALPQRYNSIARSLHWASALLIAAAFVMGLTIDALPRNSRPPYLNLHVLVGLAVVVLALVRLGWRTGHAAPPPTNSGPLATLALKLGHGALYLLMLVVPLIGFAPLFARGRQINFGLFQIASPIERTKDWIGPTDGDPRDRRLCADRAGRRPCGGRDLPSGRAEGRPDAAHDAGKALTTQG